MGKKKKKGGTNTAHFTRNMHFTAIQTFLKMPARRRKMENRRNNLVTQ